MQKFRNITKNNQATFKNIKCEKRKILKTKEIVFSWNKARI